MANNNIFKVWTVDRIHKTMVLIHEKDGVLEKLITKASQKLHIEGDQLVLESDGTPLDEDEIVIHLSKETFILLQKGEKWVSQYNVLQSDSSCVSTSSKASSSDFFIPISDDTLIANLENEDLLGNAMVTETNMEEVWSNFKIPWHKLPLDVIKHCQDGKREKQYITQIIHTIVHEMRQIKTRIPMKAYKYAAKQLVEKYPQTFKDIDSDGVVIGDGTHSAISKMSDRNHYLNRPHKRSRQSHGVINPSLRKKQINSVAGCSNWAPPVGGIEGGIEESKKDKLNSLNVENEEFYNLLEENYSAIRQFVNNIESPPTVNDVKSNWPVLFRKSAVLWHFKKLTGVDLILVKDKMESMAEKIVDYAVSKKILSAANPGKSIEEMLTFYAKHFKEDLSLISLKIQDSDREVSSAMIGIMEPCVVEYDNDHRYEVFMEKQYVFTTHEFREAFIFMFALYFIFNLEYPKKIGATLEMFQRMHCKIHPDSGSKSSSTKKKVLGLMNRLKQVV
ncbi:uncharacterized protein LOC123317679 [Coccinella septempunctata]|uniref:uncharacterized protein LOC123317679 n=1 Tax=Coccinella septempunctata TaxID=41139 RepID=UPI001D07A65B|nr:uncharacterized protein LOC123317679 [Coccinella septempunctata]